jgi:uncharacterized protein
MPTPILDFDLERMVASRLLLQANSGGGKSYMLRYLLEHTHGRIQQIVLDPEGEFSTLRERFDYLLAGKDGDVPAEPKTAKVLARRLMELGASAVIDLYDLSLDDRKRFVRLFLEELMHLPRPLWRPLLVVIDEAHNFAPEKGSAESLNAVITLCTQGRKRGFSALLATQRLSKLHKDAAAELLNKLIGRTGLDVDMSRAGDELGFDKQTRLTLRDLEPGHFYAFGPAISKHVIQVRSGKITTTHPEPGKIAPPAPPAPAAIRKLVAQLHDLAEQAKREAVTLEEKDSEITRLRTELRRTQKATPVAAADPQAIERAVQVAVDRSRKDWERGATERERAYTQNIALLNKRITKAAGFAQQLVHALSNGGEMQPIPEARTPARAIAAEAPRAPRREAVKVEPVEGVTRPQQRILNALASLEAIGLESVDKSNVAVFADQSPTSSGFANNLGAIRSAGWIHYPSGGQVALTDAGRELAAISDPIESLDQLHQAWFAKLPNPLVRILQALIDNGKLERNQLAELAAQSPTSSGYANNLGRLRSLGLIEYPERGYVDATPLLFPEGLE